MGPLLGRPSALGRVSSSECGKVPLMDRVVQPGLGGERREPPQSSTRDALDSFSTDGIGLTVTGLPANPVLGAIQLLLWRRSTSWMATVSLLIYRESCRGIRNRERWPRPRCAHLLVLRPVRPLAGRGAVAHTLAPPAALQPAAPRVGGEGLARRASPAPLVHRLGLVRRDAGQGEKRALRRDAFDFLPCQLDAFPIQYFSVLNLSLGCFVAGDADKNLADLLFMPVTEAATLWTRFSALAERHFLLASTSASSAATRSP
ncbi:hypothetical protein DFJ74DRAFT_667613 [Hyaloraphidium curvatum]|nr:hypothetical protein DFJ74DRAFT_667613 [Hyaloraphidium curvatum]